MASKTQELIDKGLLMGAPYFLETAVQYEVVMGSNAYGVATDTSDMDIYGFAIPPRDMVFPHLRGYVSGFDDEPKAFDQFQKHHIRDDKALGGKGREYDITIYSLVKYMRLLMGCNPNIIDSLFVPRRCILHMTAIGGLLRENRRLFLHKGCWSTFKGYAYTQIHKMKTKEPIGKRKKLIEEFGYDVKFAYHVVRLLNEVEQIMTEADLDLERNNEQLKAIRRGEWSQAKVEAYFEDKEKSLEALYLKSELPARPDKAKIKELLLKCLEQHYGSLEECIVEQDVGLAALRDIQRILDRTLKG